MLNELV
jgi:DENN (AEX-3) domain